MVMTSCPNNEYCCFVFPLPPPGTINEYSQSATRGNINRCIVLMPSALRGVEYSFQVDISLCPSLLRTTGTGSYGKVQFRRDFWCWLYSRVHYSLGMTPIITGIEKRPILDKGSVVLPSHWRDITLFVSAET